MRPTFDVYAEDWAPTRDAPSTFELDGTDAVEPAESDSWEPVTPDLAASSPLALVDGTRRVEIGLWQMDPSTGRVLRGVAGVYAVGATVCRPGLPADFGGLRRARLCIWAGGLVGDLGPSAGYHWKSFSAAREDPDAPLETLQNLMRDAEAQLATELAAAGWQVVLDGPLNRMQSLRSMVAGYAKTHHRQLFPDELHRKVPTLGVGSRSPLWVLGTDHYARYTCYMRVGTPTSVGSPWSGIVRLEFPAFAGLSAAQRLADQLTATLPRYAGRHHLDPRAPQNLQPVRALEGHLGRLLGPPRLATQAARAAVAHLQTGRHPTSAPAPSATAPSRPQPNLPSPQEQM